MDLDDLLDDVDISALKSKAVEKVATKNIPTKPGSEKVPEEAKKELFTSEIRPWLASSANVPKETREKWTKMAKIDIEAELVSKFQRSAAYSEWDAAPNAKRGVNKCLLDLVRSSLQSSSLTESQIQKVLTLVNPVTDSEHGKQLNLAFTKQIIKDLRVDLTSDPNYDPLVFKNLAQALVNEKS
jgi:hypothetical protein